MPRPTCVGRRSTNATCTTCVSPGSPIATGTGRAFPFGTAVHYARAITQQTAYRRFTRARCPHAESWAAECVSLPCFPEMTDDEVERVCEALR